MTKAETLQTFSASAEGWIGAILTFTAGAVDAIGLVTAGHFTSHVSGATSSTINHFLRGQQGLALIGLATLLPFVAGATASACIMAWATLHPSQNAFSSTISAQAIVILAASLLLCTSAGQPMYAAIAMSFLAFAMGMQNNSSTHFSETRMRTTHVTGTSTDIGSCLGRLFMQSLSRRKYGDVFTQADSAALSRSCKLFSGFALGGVTGWLGITACGPATGFLLVGILASLSFTVSRLTKRAASLTAV
ncbi:MAG: YoaK family protein [Caulobacteraceae bacterium]